FLLRVFSELERAKADRRNGKARAGTYAKRFAAKEACAKALGTGFSHGLWIRDCGVVANAWGRPEVVWSERGLRAATALGAGAGHVTLTDEGGLIVAVAVLEKATAGGAG
ncbi:MAG: holo-ACP synthase, partial [Proteobacteria bacterium]|nr:holo-ACP synthase [Pseudomonadota bacterium]